MTSVPLADAAEYRGGTETRILDVRIDPKSAVDSEPILLTSNGANSTTLVGESSASSSVNVRAGGIHVVSVSESQVYAGPGSFYGQAEARGSFADEFILTVPGVLTGTVARMTVGFGVSGALDGQGSGSGVGVSWGTGLTWRAGFSVFAPNDGIRWDGEGRLSVDANNVIAGGDETGTRFFDLDVVVGRSVKLEMSAFVQARSGALVTDGGRGPVKSKSSALFGNTMSWQGIVSLTDENGVPLGPFSAVSESSGFDYASAYAAAIPEPTTWALWLCGLAGIGLVRRMRTHALPSL